MARGKGSLLMEGRALNTSYLLLTYYLLLTIDGGVNAQHFCSAERGTRVAILEWLY